MGLGKLKIYSISPIVNIEFSSSSSTATVTESACCPVKTVTGETITSRHNQTLKPSPQPSPGSRSTPGSTTWWTGRTGSPPSRSTRTSAGSRVRIALVRSPYVLRP